jgi:hypothetical protein
MKKILLIVLLFIATITVGFSNNPVDGIIDIDKSTVIWMGKKVTGAHEGTVKLKSGNLEMEDGVLVGGQFDIDMNTIKNTDIGGGGAAKLEGHLKSDDFFGVENHPVAKLVITDVSAKGTLGDYKVVADLTIKGITKSIKFYTNLSDTAATAEIIIDRTDFDVRYGSGSFFDNLGDKTIYDEFTLKVNLVL